MPYWLCAWLCFLFCRTLHTNFPVLLLLLFFLTVATQNTNQRQRYNSVKCSKCKNIDKKNNFRQTIRVNSKDLLYLCKDSSDCCWAGNGKRKPHACFTAVLFFTPCVTPSSSFLFPFAFTVPCLFFFSFLLLLLLFPPSLPLASLLAEPYCIQPRQAPCKAAQLNMSHNLSTAGCEFTFHSSHLDP